MGRYGMLNCGNNFANKYGGKTCKDCNAIDNETHRMNDCKTYCAINRLNSMEKIAFDDIYASDVDKNLNVVQTILSVWDLENCRNEMRIPSP